MASVSLFIPSANKIKAIHEIRLHNLTLLFLEDLELSLTFLEEANIIWVFFSPSDLWIFCHLKSKSRKKE